jgi:hypothetical protein
MNLKKVLHSAVFIGMAVCFLASAVYGTELYLPDVKAKPGDSVTIPVMLDAVDNLSGVKLVMKYDKELLVYKGGVKTDETSSLMHIINDKNPGTLIVVMAGAKGIKGKDFAILALGFEVKKDIAGEKSTKIEITEVQMMSDQLKDIKCGVKANSITISGAASPEVKQDKKSESPAAEQKPAEPAQKVETASDKPEQKAAESEQETKKVSPGTSK